MSFSEKAVLRAVMRARGYSREPLPKPPKNRRKAGFLGEETHRIQSYKPGGKKIGGIVPHFSAKTSKGAVKRGRSRREGDFESLKTKLET